MSIIVKQMSKSFGNHVILDDISFEVPKGEIIGLIGENGVGKTTLIRCMMNIDSEYQGEVSFGGDTNLIPDTFNRVSLLHDNRVLYPQMSAYDHLLFLANIYHLDKTRITEVADQVGIQSYLHQKTGEYSLGMKQHLLIAMAIINSPTYLIMDEPFNALDPTSVLTLKKLIQQLKNKGVTILLSSHNLSLIQDLTNQVYLLKHARLTSILLNEEQHQVHYLTLSNKIDISDILRDLNLDFTRDEDSWNIRGEIVPLMNQLIERQIKIECIQSRHVSLEEIYQTLYE
ncbi:ABC transporter ATP-binding protein [Aerococcaceae bacterium zg-ZJ1578]|uniref:ABC transporter ATP-binding protein n=1 Tax=Aerococcaceae bacterium zg-252 TaxID=2796928 RepID=UPI001A33CC8F|nr:ABC transporter ATP-binding protein [Aerococcaceae bacterium zg-1578]